MVGASVLAMTAAHREFWRRHPGLVWSNPEADDATHIRAALVRPRFDVDALIALDRVPDWLA